MVGTIMPPAFHNPSGRDCPKEETTTVKNKMVTRKILIGRK
jgi:hypothetical protein